MMLGVTQKAKVLAVMLALFGGAASASQAFEEYLESVPDTYNNPNKGWKYMREAGNKQTLIWKRMKVINYSSYYQTCEIREQHLCKIKGQTHNKPIIRLRTQKKISKVDCEAQFAKYTIDSPTWFKISPAVAKSNGFPIDVCGKCKGKKKLREKCRSCSGSGFVSITSHATSEQKAVEEEIMRRAIEKSKASTKPKTFNGHNIDYGLQRRQFHSRKQSIHRKSAPPAPRRQKPSAPAGGKKCTRYSFCGQWLINEPNETICQTCFDDGW